MQTTATIDTYHLCEHMLRVMADTMGDYKNVKDERRRRELYARCNEIWHTLANGLRNREAADTCKDYANRLADLYISKGRYTRAGNFTAPYKRLLDGGTRSMVETFQSEEV